MTKGTDTARRARSIDDYRRREGTRQRRKAILIVCEGEASEPQYFRALIKDRKLGTLVDIEIVGGAKQHITLVNRAIELRDERRRIARKAERAGQLAKPPFDEIWCVFDTEVEARSTFNEAIALAKEHGFKLAISNPAFEYWLLLHFEHTTRSFHTSREVRDTLRKHLPDYAKHIDDRLFRTTFRAKIPVAVERATTILSTTQSDEDEFPHPSTGVCRLVAVLLEMSTPPR